MHNTSNINDEFNIIPSVILQLTKHPWIQITNRRKCRLYDIESIVALLLLIKDKRFYIKIKIKYLLLAVIKKYCLLFYIEIFHLHGSPCGSSILSPTSVYILCLRATCSIFLQESYDKLLIQWQQTVLPTLRTCDARHRSIPTDGDCEGHLETENLLRRKV